MFVLGSSAAMETKRCNCSKQYAVSNARAYYCVGTFFLWAWQQNHWLIVLNFLKVCLPQIRNLPQFSNKISQLVKVLSSRSSTRRCGLMFIFVCQASVEPSLRSQSARDASSLFAPAICFNCRDKVNGLTNAVSQEAGILWAIFCPCGGTHYYFIYIFFCVASVLAVTGALRVFDLGG